MTIAKPVPDREQEVLTAIRYGAHDIESIARATGLGRPRVKAYLASLFDKRLVLRIHAGVYDVRPAAETRKSKASTLEPSSIQPIPLSRLMGGQA